MKQNNNNNNIENESEKAMHTCNTKAHNCSNTNHMNYHDNITMTTTLTCINKFKFATRIIIITEH